MNQKKIIIGGLVVFGILVIIALVLFKGRSGTQTNTGDKNQVVSMDDPIDIALDFYNPWLDAVKSTSADPYTLELHKNEVLSENLRTQLASTQGHPVTDIDPVLCQTTVPERVTARVVSKNGDEIRILIVSKDKTLTAQSTFILKKLNDGYFINSIECALGEFELPREFTFDKEGFLLKSVPPPLDSKYWHIVFEDNGELGHAVPLFFDADSTCTASDGNSAPCVPDQFTEASKIHVFGQMTELGVEVKKIEFEE